MTVLQMGAGRDKASPEDKLAMARDYVSKNAPYFSKILYALQFIAVPGLGTFNVTSGLVCGYDPVYVAKNTPEMIAGDIAHEILHVYHRHIDRMKECLDHDLANLAMDLPINVDLRDAMDRGKPVWHLHPTFVFPADFGLPDGLTGEAYYKLLEEKRKTASPEPGVGSGRCGSVAGTADPEALAGVEGRSEVELAAIMMQVAKAVKDHAAGPGRGSMPASILDAVDIGERRSKRDWRRHLGSIVRDCTGRIQAGGDDFSLRRPSKRSYVRGMLRPGLIENQPGVGFVLDTSGSMGQEQLIASVVEAVAILEALGIDEVWFAEADAGISMKFQMVGTSFFRKLRIAGRGGTDFRPAFAAAKKLNPPPDLLIYFTDGDGLAPAAPPRGMETVWCIVPSYCNRRPAAWGHTVLITDDPRAKLRAPMEYDEEYA